MRSSLSHNVCRQLVACHGLSAPISALSISSHASLRPVRRPRPVFRHSTRRTFLSKLFNNAPREVKDVGFEPGFESFVEFQTRVVEGVKLPDREELVKAFRIFFNNKLNHKRPVNHTEAFHACLVLEHFSKGEPGEPTLLVQDCRIALSALLGRWKRRQNADDIIKLASMLYGQLRIASFPDTASTGKEDHDQHRFEELCSGDMKLYINVLTEHGASQDAAKVLAGFKDLTHRFFLDKPNRLSELHLMVLLSLAKERNPAVKSYAKDLEATGFKYYPEFHEALTTFCASAEQGSAEKLRRWFEKPIADEQMARPGAYLALIKYSAATGARPVWLIKAIQNLCDLNPPKAWWDVILQWAVYQGKDINQIKHMINVMVQLNEHDESTRADISTINGLIAAALDTKNILLTERIYALTSELGLRPNTKTQTLLLQARIAGRDTVGAASAFDEILQSSPLVPGSEAEDVINQYVRYLCFEISDSKVILNVLSQIERRRGELDPDTVVVVCSNFLKNDKAIDVIDTLGLHLKKFSREDRRIVQISLQEYCLDKGASTARAWDCYNLLRQFFPEMDRKERVRLMNSFFDRKRADMATQVFGHMRAHPNDEIRPDLEAYVACFEGLGACPDEESLQMVHNMLKTDARIQPNTRLYNALMLAYAADEQPRKAYGFFQLIANSTEGPSYASLEIVFRACGIMSDGYERAKAIWDKIQRLEIEVPLDVFDAYILMMAGQGRMEDIKSLLNMRTADYGVPPTPTL